MGCKLVLKLELKSVEDELMGKNKIKLLDNKIVVFCLAVNCSPPSYFLAARHRFCFFISVRQPMPHTDECKTLYFLAYAIVSNESVYNS